MTRTEREEMDLSNPQHFTKEQSEWIKAYCIKRNIEFYNKAIDDLMEKVSECFISDADWNYLVQEAGHLKAGGENE